jgi:hypothetical protein
MSPLGRCASRPGVIDSQKTCATHGSRSKGFGSRRRAPRSCSVNPHMTAFAHRLDAADPVLFVLHQHSSKDQAFADRLHSRMVQEKLRIWYAPEDMRGGIWPRSTGGRRSALQFGAARVGRIARSSQGCRCASVGSTEVGRSRGEGVGRSGFFWSSANCNGGWAVVTGTTRDLDSCMTAELLNSARQSR